MIRKSPVFFIKDNQIVYYPKGDEVDINVNGRIYKATIHGAGWLESKLVYQSSHLTTFNPSFFFNQDFYSSFRGNLCLYFYNEDESYIYQDPLGGTSVFYYLKNEVFACASDMGELIKVLALNNVHLTKNMDYITELLCTGTGGIFQTSYEDVFILDTHTYIKVKNNKVHFHSTETKRIIFENKYSIEDARDEIQSNVNALLDYNHLPKVAHITGGYDSRLVFSALTSESASDYNHNNLYYACHGYSELLDKQVAKQICDTFGKVMVNNEGVLRSVERTNLKDTYGMSLDTPPLFRTRHEAIISGGFGETLRSTYANSIIDYDGNLEEMGRSLVIEKMYGSAIAGNEENRIVSTDFYEKFQNRVNAKIDSFKGSHLDIYSTLDYLYLSIRNRYFVGQISTNYSNVNPRLDPLYSPISSSYALRMDARSRSKNILGLELMYMFNPKLLTVPFEGREIPERFRSKYNIKVVDLNLSASPKTKDFKNFRLASDSSQPKAMPEHIKHANKINAPLWQVVAMKDTQSKLLRLLNDIGKKEVSDCFSWKYLHRICNNELNNRIHLRRLYAVYDALSWYYDYN